MGVMDKKKGGFMPEQERNEKEEEKSRGWEDWCKGWWEGLWRSDRLDAIGWAAIFFWGALVLLAETTNYKANFNWWDGWAVFFTGAGVIVLVEAVIRLLIREYRRRLMVVLIFGFILLGIGLGGWGWVWPLVLIAIGVIMLLSAFARRR